MTLPTQPATPQSKGTPELAPSAAVPKPIESKQTDLDAALAAALGTDADKPMPVDPDKATADLKNRFAGKEPTEFVGEQIGYYIVDINAVRANPQLLADETKRFNGRSHDEYVIRNRTSEVAAQVIKTVSNARQEQVDFHDSQVQDLFMKELTADTIQYLEVQNAIAAGSVTLKELKQFDFYQTILSQNPPGTAILFPQDNIHREIAEGGRSNLWKKLVAGDAEVTENTQRLAKDNRPDQQQLLDELGLTKEWDGLGPAKQREIIEYAAGRSLDRIGQLGDRLLKDRNPAGLVLLTVSGRISADHISLVAAIPQGKELLTKFAEIRKIGGNIRFAITKNDSLFDPDTIVLEPGLKIKGFEKTDGKIEEEYAPYTKGVGHIAQQMMGMKPLEPKPQQRL